MIDNNVHSSTNLMKKWCKKWHKSIGQKWTFSKMDRELKIYVCIGYIGVGNGPFGPPGLKTPGPLRSLNEPGRTEHEPEWAG